MLSNVDPKMKWTYWQNSEKFKGLFKLQWLFAKDVPLNQFKEIFINNEQGQIPVGFARDCQ